VESNLWGRQYSGWKGYSEDLMKNWLTDYAD
jgi:hypothetical protein